MMIGLQLYFGRGALLRIVLCKNEWRYVVAITMPSHWWSWGGGVCCTGDGDGGERVAGYGAVFGPFLLAYYAN